MTDSTFHHTCIGIHVDYGGFENCAKGGYCDSIARTLSFAPDPFGKFCVSKVNAYLGDFQFGIIYGHFSSRSVHWRVNAIRSIFDDRYGVSPLADQKYNLILGDFNMDPFRSNDASAEEWRQYAGPLDANKDYWHHSRVLANNKPETTHSFMWRHLTLDHIVTNFAVGDSVVLGMTPDTSRLDGGLGMDHHAVLAKLQIAPTLAQKQ